MVNNKQKQDSSFVEQESNTNIIKSFFIYFIIFLLIVPYFLFKSKSYDILESYMPNVDLVANILTFHSGIFSNNLFRNLYNQSPQTQAAFLSQSGVNYLALLGVTFIISRETKLSNSIAYGWSTGFIMLLMTYLLPAGYINDAMAYVYSKTNGSLDKTKQQDILSNIYVYGPSLITGIALTIGVILLEKNIISYLRKNLYNIAEFLMKLPSKI
jgi:hypothetical protein